MQHFLSICIEMTFGRQEIISVTRLTPLLIALVRLKLLHIPQNSL